MSNISCVALALLVLGCAASATVTTPPPQAGPPAYAPAEPPPAPGPSAEELAAQAKQEQDKKQLQLDRALLQLTHRSEQVRLTPQLRSATSRLADRHYGSTRAAIDGLLQGKHRRPGNQERDVYRHPKETLLFLGVKPTDAVLEYGIGEGWYTELLAPLLAKRGKLFVTNTDPNGPPDDRSTFYAERASLFLQGLPEAYGKVESVIFDPRAAPKLALPDSNLDHVLLIRSAHGMVNRGQLNEWLAEFRRTLKDGGSLGVVQHRAIAGADPQLSSKQGYLPEQWLIEQVEAAGFKLAERSELNANPKDTKDHPAGVWTLPPTLRLGAIDHEKYLAIGESDRMTLKFVKIAAPPPTPATPVTRENQTPPTNHQGS